MNHTTNSQKGMTILELMVVVAITGILMSLGIASFIGMKKDLDMKTAARTLVQDFKVAQANAIRQGAPFALSETTVQDSFLNFCNDNLCEFRDANEDDFESVTFNSSGFVTDPTALPLRVTLRACDTGAGVAVTVQRTGRVQATAVANGPC